MGRARRSPGRWLAQGAALAALAAAVVAGGRPEERVARAARLLDEGRAQEALVGLEGAGEGDARVQYLRGTAHLALGSWAAGVDPLAAAAAAAADPELRRRAWHNLSVARLRLALDAEGPAAAAHAGAAAGAAMEALRLGPGSPGARWNLALAWRLLEGATHRAAAVDGRPAEDGGPGGEAGVGERPGAPASAGMSPGQAERLLDALRSAEGARAVAGLVEGRAGAGRAGAPERGPPW